MISLHLDWVYSHQTETPSINRSFSPSSLHGCRYNEISLAREVTHLALVRENRSIGHVFSQCYCSLAVYTNHRCSSCNGYTAIMPHATPSAYLGHGDLRSFAFACIIYKRLEWRIAMVATSLVSLQSTSKQDSFAHEYDGDVIS